MKTLSALLFVPVEQVVVLELVDLAIQDGFHVAAFAVGPVVLDQTVRLEGVGADLAAEGDGVLARILGGALGFAFLQLEGVNDRDAAEALRGAEVYVDRKHAIKLGADENFVCELIGLKAVDENGETVGTLRDVLKPNTVCDVYVFDTARGELMIPALKRVVRRVDVDAGVMELDSAALAEVAVWEDEPAERDE